MRCRMEVLITGSKRIELQLKNGRKTLLKLSGFVFCNPLPHPNPCTPRVPNYLCCPTPTPTEPLLSGLLFQHACPLQHISPSLPQELSPGTFPSFLNLCAHQAPSLPPPDMSAVRGGSSSSHGTRDPQALPPWDSCLQTVYWPLVYGNKKPRASQAEAWPGSTGAGFQRSVPEVLAPLTSHDLLCALWSCRTLQCDCLPGRSSGRTTYGKWGTASYTLDLCP